MRPLELTFRTNNRCNCSGYVSKVTPCELVGWSDGRQNRTLAIPAAWLTRVVSDQPTKSQGVTFDNKQIISVVRQPKFSLFQILSVKQCYYVQKYISIGLPVHTVQHRQQTATNMGQKSAKRPHKKDHRSGHSIIGLGNYRNQCEHNLYYLPGRSKEDSRNQIAIFSHDYQKFKEIFHI